MSYGQISANESINVTIYDCFQHLERPDVERFAREFQSQPHDGSQVLHTFRELVLGSYLARRGFRVRAYHKYDGQVPDWSIFGEKDELLAIIDVVNFHADIETEHYVRSALSAGTFARVGIDTAECSLRFFQSVKNKCAKYRGLTESLNIPYVIGFFPQYEVVVDRSQILENLHSPDFGLFRKIEDGGYPNVSGLVNYPDDNKPDSATSVAHVYAFEYYPNPHALRPFAFPEGQYYAPLLLSSRPRYLRLLAQANALGQLDQFKRPEGGTAS